MATPNPGGGATAGRHSLAFRVMRLCRPSFHADATTLRVLPGDLIAGEDLLSNPSVSPSLTADALSSISSDDASDFSFRDRFLLDDPSGALAISGLLVLPQSFGAIYLGETFCSYISINNSSEFDARDVTIKAEIQTEKQKISLLDTTKSPVDSIRAGGRYDFIVQHDIKELGSHTLVCSASYIDGDGERKHLPQYFKFVVANPLSVRTKVRCVKDVTFMEACIENHTKSNLFMDQVEFEPTPHWTATPLKPDDHPTTNDRAKRGIFRPPNLIRAGGGIFNYLYQLRQSSRDSGQAKVDGSNILGKLQITWRTNLGEPGRLQTQHIIGTPTTHKDVDLQILEVPSPVILERPFSVKLTVINQTDRLMGPFEVYLSHGTFTEEKAVMVNGIQKLVISSLGASMSAIFFPEYDCYKGGRPENLRNHFV